MLSLATFGECLSSCSVFYALDPSNHSLIFASDEETEHIQNILRNNVVAVMQPILWKLKFESIKMTDNTLGFGKKLFWSLS